MRDHDIRLDWLRVFGSFAVVVLHVSADYVVSGGDASSARWWVANLFDSASRWAGDAIFLMIGGALLLSRPSEQAPFAFASARMRRVLPALLFWSAFYLGWRWLRSDGMALAEVMRMLVQGKPHYHLWFLYMLTGMYLATPLLRAVLASAAPGMQRYLLLTCLGYTLFESYARAWYGLPYASFASLVPLFFVHFLLGHHLYENPPKLAPRVLVLCFAGCVAVVAVGAALAMPAIGMRGVDLFYMGRGLPVIAMAACVFSIGLACLREDGIWRRWHARGGGAIAGLALGIYVIHPFWIEVVAAFGVVVTRWHSLVAIPMLSVLVYVLSLASVFAMSRVPMLARAVR